MMLQEDLYGLKLTTSAEAAGYYNDALGRLLAVRSGAEALLDKAIAADPGFALAHAVLADQLASHGAGPDRYGPVVASAGSAAEGVTERERSLVAVATASCKDRACGAGMLVRHVKAWPRDAYAASQLAPSIASGGVPHGLIDSAQMLDDLAPAYGDDWWLASMRAFTRAEQLRFSEAEELASLAMEQEPAAGHACHAQAHVLYETGRHGGGPAWLDRWMAGPGSDQAFSSHFTWHAALFELAAGDIDALRARFDRDLAPIRDCRALIDSGSLVARSELHGLPLGPARAEGVRAAAGCCLTSPSTPFMAWNAAVLAAVLGDGETLEAVARTVTEHDAAAKRAWVTARGSSDPDQLAVGKPDRLADDQKVREAQHQAWSMVGRVCTALQAALAEQYSRAADLLLRLGDTRCIDGSPAQREIIEDLGMDCLRKAGRGEQARRIACARLERRSTVFDRRLCSS